MASRPQLFGDEHVKRYQATGGKEGHDWQGTQCLILTTKGRKTGEWHSNALIYGTSGDKYAIVASKGGAPDDPGWYKNLSADSHVRVQVWDDVFDATARDAEGAERDELWKIMTAEWPAYDDYQKKTDRRIPVVVLERA
jgi:deazaflavin-dependent oxidoreductase (nitroreductase family)